MLSDKSLIERDHQCIWHPFSQHGLAPDFLPVQSAQGAWLTLENGKKLLDAASSWWVNIHGHSHSEIVEAIYQQAQKLDHAVFGNVTHEPAVALAEKLLNAVQQKNVPLTRCFYADNGATAVEAAMKMVFQYYKNQNIHSRTRFIALNNAYHGDTVGAMGVSDRNYFGQKFLEMLPQVDYIDVGDIQGLKKLLFENPKQHAAILIEPMIQGVYGMRIHTAEFLQELEKVCCENEIMMICDEIFTGFYRTGTCFAFEHANIQPDIICLSKGITGGFLPLAVTLTTEDIFSKFYSEEVGHAFLHGHSYTANPIACAAALKSWEILHRDETQQAIARISKRTAEWMKRFSENPQFDHPRAIGTIGAVNIRNMPGYYSKVGRNITKQALQRGVLLRPLGPVMYAVPPYCVTDTELDLIYETMEAIVHNSEVLR